MRFTLHDGWSETVLRCGCPVYAHHAEQPGQADVAASIGLTVAEMNRTHDAAHVVIARALRCPSIALENAGHGRAGDARSDAEEAAALALQRYAALVGVDLAKLASGPGS